MLKSFPHLFMNILPVCLKKVLTQGGNFSYRIVILHVKARYAWGEVDAQKFTIPARSPDLNPIGKIFHIVKRRLCQDALDQRITGEDFAAFSARFKNTLETIHIGVVDITILTTGKRINEIIKRKGQRIKC